VDYKYAYALVSFAVGMASGFQGIRERYDRDAVDAARTLPGIVYLFSRGVLPAVVFSFLYAYGYLQRFIFLESLACGTGAELVLRMTFYVKQQKQGGGFEELLRGPLDLLKFYQSFWLEAIAGRRAESRKRIVQSVIRDTKFQDLVTNFGKNSGAWPDARLVGKLVTEVQELEASYKKELAAGGDANLDEIYKFKIGFLILNRLGKTGLKTLLST
jgi:hypothetical protein